MVDIDGRTTVGVTQQGDLNIVAVIAWPVLRSIRVFGALLAGAPKGTSTVAAMEVSDGDAAAWSAAS